MRIRRIEVPSFRVLQDVDMVFDAGFEPQIFPIGSENGGGKSTLLQLVFGLLHCAADEARHPYLRNLLANARLDPTEPEQRLARLTLEVDGREVALEFVLLGFEALREGFGEDPPPDGFHALDALATVDRDSDRLRGRDYGLRRLLERLPEGDRESPARQRPLTSALYQLASAAGLSREYQRARSPSDLVRPAMKALAAIEETVETLSEARKSLASWVSRVEHMLSARGEMRLITVRPPARDSGGTRLLVCRAPGLDRDDVRRALTKAGEGIFLLGPSNQQYLFLGRASRKALVSASSLDYLAELNAAEEALPAFFAYDWLSIDPLVKLFAAARDRDFEAVVTTGAYGDHYTSMLADINGLLAGKSVRPLPDLEGIEFIAQRPDGAEIELGPEDLSRGELKRLMIYAWLKANHATDAVVLIDEVEASFHPDWQFRIIRDLQEWAPGNQYLLATHSYDLCEALTPGHVRELAPELGTRIREETQDGA